MDIKDHGVKKLSHLLYRQKSYNTKKILKLN